MNKTVSLTKDGVPWLQAQCCNTTLTRARGLMFSDPHPTLFLFPHPLKVCLHMLFVRFPLTALFLDEEKRVRELQYLKPWTVGRPASEPVRYVLEIPGTFDCPINTQLDWKPQHHSEIRRPALLEVETDNRPPKNP